MLTKQKRTFILDSARGAFDGVHLTLAQTVILLVAVKYFGVSDGLKSLISAAPFIGHLVSVFYVARMSTTRLRKSTLASVPALAAGALLAFSRFAQDGTVYATGTTIAMVVFAMKTPFLTGIYEENFSHRTRGLLFSGGVLTAIVSSIACNYTFGAMLKRDPSSWQLVMLVAAASSLASGMIIHAMPSGPPALRNSTNPLRNMRVLIDNPRFGYVLSVWFIAGFANLWVKPLKVVWLAESERGLDLDPAMVLLFMGVIPEVTRLLFTQVWAVLFDRMNFVVLRMLLNGLQAVGLLLFFWGDNLWVIGLGSLSQGLGYAGGAIAWHLWVTKFAPPGQSQVYMSVHTFFTGVRGIIGPYLGFMFIAAFSIRQASLVSCGMLLLSVVLLYPLARIVAGEAAARRS